jgi:hypothetical protein
MHSREPAPPEPRPVLVTRSQARRPRQKVLPITVYFIGGTAEPLGALAAASEPLISTAAPHPSVVPSVLFAGPGGCAQERSQSAAKSWPVLFLDKLPDGSAASAADGPGAALSGDLSDGPGPGLRQLAHGGSWHGKAATDVHVSTPARACCRPSAWVAPRMPVQHRGASFLASPRVW